VSAFDDNISISAPCETEFVGGLNGEMLRRTIEKAFGDEVDPKVDKQAVVFKVNRTDLKLPIMDLEHRQFEMPQRNKKAVLQVSKKLLRDQLRFCLESLGTDVTHPEWCGITIELAGDDLHIYSGYSQVLARAVVPLEARPKFKRIILHEKFCKQVLAYPKADLELSDSHALLCDGESGVTVFGRSIGGAGGLKLGEMLKIALDRADKFVPMPTIHGMLERASIFEGDHLNMKVAVVKQSQGKRLRMVSEAGEGKLVDFSTTLKEDHPEVEVATNAKHLKSGADIPDAEIAIGVDEIVIRGGDATLVVSVASPRT
jgi:hypothetical protein